MRKLLIIIIILGLISSVYLIFDRYQVEMSNRVVELTIDYKLLKDFQQTEILTELKKIGVNSVAIYEQSLESLSSNNTISYYFGRELNFFANFLPKLEKVNNSDLYISGDNKFSNKLREVLISRFGEDRVLTQKDVLILSDFDKESLEEPLYFSEAEVKLINSLGFNLIPRISNNIDIKEFDELLANLPAVKEVIFNGESVLGFPNRIKETAEILKDREVKLGIIEAFIAKQQGVDKLAQMIDLKAIRVHSLQQAELAKLGIEATVNRYIRAVKERNVRNLYLKPFADRNKTLEFVKLLVKDLNEEGYQLGSAQGFKKLKPHKLAKFLVVISVVSIFSLILSLWSIRLFYLSFIIDMPIASLLYLLKPNQSLEIIALLIAIISPVLSFRYLINKIHDSGDILQSYKVFFKSTSITIIGVLLMLSLLVSDEYLLKVRYLRGIKLSFILPLILSFIYYLYYQYKNFRDLKDSIIKLLKRPLFLYDIVIIFVVVVVAIIYLSRTGNNPIIPVSNLELKFRELLEEVLVIRPRFKSFLFGHPLLILGIYLSNKKKGYLWINLLGLIGQINIINTFSHLHTPLLISTIRVLTAIVLGSAIGLLLIIIFDSILDRYNRLRGSDPL
ncbi:DUF5693 family protein [Orenia marismortui]|uniref:Uncharacterized protein n=1 Tax=Orenia marismortui TaxID=46469 RepID=A0A4R8H9U8_9FIRM|nr:DUF5693 family protein [Orenia marismortui]TDX52458.1 hypothetical protein C7959_10621 [Orenia marismortui]